MLVENVKRSNSYYVSNNKISNNIILDNCHNRSYNIYILAKVEKLLCGLTQIVYRKMHKGGINLQSSPIIGQFKQK